MKAYFRAIKRIKKRQFIQKLITTIILAYAAKYSRVTQTTNYNLLVNYNQRLQPKPSKPLNFYLRTRDGMGLSSLVTSIHTLSPLEGSHTSTHYRNLDSILVGETTSQIRGGSGLSDITAVILFVILMNWYDYLLGVESFQANPLPHRDTFDFMGGKDNPKNIGPSIPSRDTACLSMKKPSSMPQPEYSGMTKSERRQLPDPRDGFIDIQGYPRLDLRFNQVEFKTPKHGVDHGLPITDSGKTPKTEAMNLMNSLMDMPDRQNIMWYTDGQYQGGTARGCNCVHLFDPDTNLIAVYSKQPDGCNLFLTTCKLTEREAGHLIDTNGNFTTERVLNTQNALNKNIQNNNGL